MTVSLLSNIEEHLHEIHRLAMHHDVDMLLAIQEVAEVAIGLLRTAPPPTKRQSDRERKKKLPCLKCGKLWMTTIGIRTCPKCKNSRAYESGLL